MMAVGLVSTAAVAQTDETYYGCITPEAVLFDVGIGEAPANHCAATDTLIAWNAMGPAGEDGAKGAQGDPGPQGENGAKGEAGADGENGKKGAAGEPGAAGADGAAGPAGEAGAQGDPGAAGADGADGATGPAGSAGPAGEMGAQGAAGADGADGAAGPVGDVGPQGPQGETGSAGADGADGEAGPAGPQGEVGPQGEQGPPIESASGFARVPRNSRTVTVTPGVEVGLGTVVTVTPFANLRDRAFWVTRDLEADTFTIRLSASRGSATPFSWLIVESGIAETAAPAE